MEGKYGRITNSQGRMVQSKKFNRGPIAFTDVWADEEPNSSVQMPKPKPRARSKSMSQSMTYKGPVCGKYPYPNDQLVSQLECTIHRAVLCRIRDILFDQNDVRDNALSFPQVFDGAELGNNNRLSPRQMKHLKEMLKVAYSSINAALIFNIDALVACKIVLGRWLRPSEMTGLFGKTASTLVMKRYNVTAEDSDTKVQMNGRDPRISFAIGKGGSTLNDVTSRSKSIYIWFGNIQKQVVALIYARKPQSLEQARTMINKQQSMFKGKGLIKSGFKLEANTGAPRQVSMSALYQLLER